MERNWKVPADERINSLIVRATAKDKDNDTVTFGIRASEYQDGSHLFYINNRTGVVYLAANLSDKVDNQYYLYVTASDSHGAQVSNEVWVEILPPAGDRDEFEPLPTRNTRPQLPPNLNQPRPGGGVIPVLPPEFARPPPREPPIRTTEQLQVTTETTAAPTATAAPPAATEDTSDSAFDVTPLVVTLVVLLVLVPTVVYGFHFFRKRRQQAKNRSLKAGNFSIEFQRRSGLSQTSDKALDEPSSTWRHFDSKGIDATKWNLGHTNLSFVSTTSASGDSGPDKKWEFPRHHLRILHQLGEGCFGQVWKVEALDMTGVEGVSTVAVKTLKEAAGEKERRDLLQEMEMMKLLDPHPNVVTMLGCCTEKDPIFLIMEYVSRGKLQTYLRESRTPNDYNNLHGPSAMLTSRDLTTFAHQVARGMHYLTEKGIIHRDLAARNVLVSEERVCKVADFGFARDIIASHVYERKTEGRLPIRWMAPESLYDNIFTAKSDVWSFGILLWEIVTLGSTPYPGMSAQEVMKKVREGYRLDKPEHCRRELFNLMYYCWSASPDARPGFGEIVETLEKLLLTEMDYIELDRFPEHSYYNLTGNLSGEKV
ncbi:tyrosine kinase receptor Cad96Ca-like [Amphibalanus amphitrite]|uniref:tyrosine kinase receptor Cad96Ca-like n=1 Tax=Amphibalanus amphitrite TaxID=1232801 RepID=UPI001C91437A|nr:tyrosine kinase receptor Cad96Ca-like [Amphibalanus amphitrite]